MDKDLSLTDRLRENRIFLNRIAVSVFVMGLAILGLVIRLVYLQVVGHGYYSTLSNDNRVKVAALPPQRGIIVDRNGEVLASNFPTRSLELIPEQISDIKKTLADLQTLLNLGDDEIQRFNSTRTRHKPFESIPLREQLTDEEIARISVRLPHYPGVSIRTRSLRVYPYSGLTAHAIGYVGRISEADMQELDASVYSGTYHIGKSGVEKTYESVLHGKTGYEEMETNVQGRSINVIGRRDSVAGADLQLSLDIRLQKIAYDALGEYNGSVVAIEPSTGQVLAMVSKPSFDPNLFVQGIKRADFENLQLSPDRPLYNRASRGIYPPGSTIKPFMALTALDSGQMTASQRVHCPGFFRLPNSEHKYRDWNKQGHGSVDMKLAITQSCDVYFYSLALQMGIDRIHNYLTRFGFGQKSGIDLDSEKAALLPSQEWKRKKRKQPWFAGETVITGIGQGYFQATPLQIARAVAILANKGKVITPRVVAGIKTPLVYDPPFPLPRQEIIPISEANWRTVVSAMIDVIHSSRGTAKSIAHGLDYQIAGKTGTAQVFTVQQNQNYKSMHVTEKLKDHAWFVAFAPADNPQIAIAVIAENGGHGGSVAAPIARLVFDAYLHGAKQ
ncbi:penicillin-binding protein 2 [Candidatus Methylospira mobilis]|uniref:Peptidoglycan D,D-transpeptidase MrdA n=1 Tax=Candidatus Methylospira mobilis TaxID=1808979 RepID=A0A5Q0BI34_9GAMM|nr:penicillin-binding protein 2 [Candidatus Methylospira mobilis]QFY41486.1 penicillin-binding protein 2 [Candidatus Methylospira mobilis]